MKVKTFTGSETAKVDKRVNDWLAQFGITPAAARNRSRAAHSLQINPFRIPASLRCLLYRPAGTKRLGLDAQRKGHR